MWKLYEQVEIVLKIRIYLDEAVMEVQAEEGGGDGAVAVKARGYDAFDGGLNVGAVAFPFVESDLQGGVAGDGVEAHQNEGDGSGYDDLCGGHLLRCLRTRMAVVRPNCCLLLFILYASVECSFCFL